MYLETIITVFGTTFMSFLFFNNFIGTFLISCFLVYYFITIKDRISRQVKLIEERLAMHRLRKQIINDEETTEWLNTLTYRFWNFYEPELCNTIRQGLKPIFEDIRNTSITGLELQKLTLGKQPPFIYNAKVLTKNIPENRIVLHVTLGFLAPDLNIVIWAKLANFSIASVPLALKDFFFKGKLRVEIDLVPEFPHAQTVMFTFLKKPIFDFDLLPLQINIMDIPGIAQLIKKLLLNEINAKLVEPQMIVRHLFENSVEHVDLAVGVIFVTVDNIKSKKTLFDVIIEISTKLEKIKISKDETVGLLVSNPIHFERLIMSFSQKHKKLENIHFDIENSHQHIENEWMSFNATIKYAPVTELPTNIKIISLIIHKATDILSNEFSDPYVVIYDNDIIIGKSNVVLKSLSPTWNYIKEFVAIEERQFNLSLKIFDSQTFGLDKCLCELSTLDVNNPFEKKWISMTKGNICISVKIRYVENVDFPFQYVPIQVINRKCFPFCC